jgi:hypothetical protein
VNKRLKLLLILVAGMLVALFAWPRVRNDALIADVTLAALTHPRHEVVVSGQIRNFGASPFSLETLLIEEPGKEPYRRQVSLDADNVFELALGKPSPGTYRVSVQTHKPAWGSGVRTGWLKLPDLVIAKNAAAEPKRVGARDFDDRRLFGFAGLGLVIGTILVVACVVQWRGPRPT